jgi:phosphate transport system permease protein
MNLNESISAATTEDEAQRNAAADHKGSRKFLHIIRERIIENIFLVCACVSILSAAAITVYTFINGSPAIFKIGLSDFLLGTEWKPGELKFGILPMILSSVYATLGAVVIGVSIGLFTAIFLAEIAPAWLVRIFKPAIDLLAGIPSVVYGFFGLVVIVPLISKYLGGVGNSLLAGIVILSIMILPTIVSISETSIRAVPSSYKEGSLALGATHIQTIFKIILPAARSGILAAVVLGIGRAIGETMAVIMVIGNNPIMPDSILQPVRTLTANIVTEMGYAQGLHQEALFSTGVVLFIFIMIINIILNFVTHKAGEKI